MLARVSASIPVSVNGDPWFESDETYALDLANKGLRQAVTDDPALALGVNAVGGTLVSEPVAEAHGMPVEPLSSVLAGASS